MLLAIDTATQFLSLALHDQDTLIAEQTWRTGNRHNTLLATSIQAMLAMCEITPEALTAVAVSIGPGSYTGLRVGVAMAKGIAQVRKLPLIGISTLDTMAAAQPFQNAKHTLLTVVQAGRGRIIVGPYRVKKGRWMADAEPMLTTWEKLLTDMPDGSYYVTGEVDDEGRKRITEHAQESAPLTLVSATQRARRAGFLAQEAWRALDGHSPDEFDAVKVHPIYLKSES
jgi:tRNA threonylcarbamoyladenosine biosynthesis protein TsaB